MTGAASAGGTASAGPTGSAGGPASTDATGSAGGGPSAGTGVGSGGTGVSSGGMGGSRDMTGSSLSAEARQARPGVGVGADRGGRRCTRPTLPRSSRTGSGAASRYTHQGRLSASTAQSPGDPDSLNSRGSAFCA